MNILFYYPDKERGVSLSSLMIAFQQQGHQVYLLTQSSEGDLHHDVQKHGVKTSCYVIKKGSSLFFYLKHIMHLISFTRKNKINLVYSHIQRANFISVFAQFFSPSKFILCRHHSDCAFVDNNLNEKMMDKIINFLGKEFIVPSDKVLNQMISVEKVKNKKIHLIRYAYNFDDYPKPDLKAITEIREKYPAKLLLIKVARLIVEKRHILLFKTINKLVLAGFDVKLLILSDGPERKKLLSYITENNLQNHIFMLGYRRDIMNFVSASDLVIHISESEASSNFVKEVGLLKKPIIVCHDVGDFDEYLVHKINSIIINKTNPKMELENLIANIYLGTEGISELGENLHQTVLKRFSLMNIIKAYDQFHVESK
jgi:glycosyltransferase involved in cell wall biosynthesis